VDVGTLFPSAVTDFTEAPKLLVSVNWVPIYQACVKVIALVFIFGVYDYMCVRINRTDFICVMGCKDYELISKRNSFVHSVQ